MNVTEFDIELRAELQRHHDEVDAENGRHYDNVDRIIRDFTGAPRPSVRKAGPPEGRRLVPIRTAPQPG